MSLHPEDGDHPLRDDLQRLILRADLLRPRSMQVAIGPSQVGNPCDRSLAYVLTPDTGNDAGPTTVSDPIPSIVGSAVHAWLAEAADIDNRIESHLGGQPIPRWLVEQRVKVPFPSGIGHIAGSADLYDCWTHTVIDHKVVGFTTLQKVKVERKVSQQYRAQVHLYGLGMARDLGLTPKHVAIAFLPRNGPLRESRLWTEPWDEQLALRAMERLELIAGLGNWADVPAQPSDEACRWCAVPMDACPEGMIYR